MVVFEPTSRSYCFVRACVSSCYSQCVEISEGVVEPPSQRFGVQLCKHEAPEVVGDPELLVEGALLAVGEIRSEAEGSGSLVVEEVHVRAEVLRVDHSLGARIEGPLGILAVGLVHLVSEHVCLLITAELAPD